MAFKMNGYTPFTKDVFGGKSENQGKRRFFGVESGGFRRVRLNKERNKLNRQVDRAQKKSTRNWLKSQNQ